PDVEAARVVVEGALGEGRSLLSSGEAWTITSAFHIPTLPLREARSAREALVAAEILGFPVALKIDSPDISHKSDVGGVVLNLGSARELQQAYRRLMQEIARERPEARIRGVTVQPMVSSPHGRDLLLGVTRDPVFGPAITFGAGGTAVEILKDSAVALPPLNAVLAERLIDRTRVARLLEGFRRMPAADRQAVVRMLLRVSEMACELPQVRELDINPLIVDEQGARAVDVRIIVERPPPRAEPYAHMAIHPYPSALEHRTQLADGTDLVIRPMRPEDAEMEREFVRELSPQSKYMRFMQSIKELTPEMLVRFTQPDYDREMALIAVVTLGGRRREVGVARYAINPDGESCEFALVVSDELHKRGIGSRLMERLMEAARERGLARMEGEVLAENRPMLNLCRELDFTIRTAPDDPGVRIVDRRL
ncbi:MAG: GNAT family N-acetyltransferase, partial [Chromatiales bacterium]